MTDHQAKEILSLYRPGTADAEDPSFAEALALCEQDLQLKLWFDQHCAVYSAFRSKFKQIAVPEGLKEQIIAERPRLSSEAVARRTSTWQKVVLAAGAVAVAITIASHLGNIHREPHDFATYCNHVIGSAARGYGMDEETSSLEQIRSFLASQPSAISDYYLPAGLEQNAKAVGCAVRTWQGKKYSMICFASGRPLGTGEKSDLWLFVSGPSVATDTPVAKSPRFEKLNGLNGIVAATWTTGDRTYVLAAPGDEQYLSKFLPL